MQKVLNKFNSNQTEANAMLLVNYVNKHPMAMLTATNSDGEALNLAITLIREALNKGRLASTLIKIRSAK